MKTKTNRRLMVASLVGVLAGASAGANTITPGTLGFLPGVSISYSATLTSGEIHAGDGFTIFDIGGFVGFGAVDPAWLPSSGALGSPWGVAPLGVDSSDINVTFTYIGAPVEAGFGSAIWTPFTVLTTSTTFVTDNWVSRDHLIGVGGVIDGDLGPGDRGNIFVPAHIPDNGMMIAMMGMGIGGLGLLRRRMIA